jgi:hypothetical protein
MKKQTVVLVFGLVWAVAAGMARVTAQTLYINELLASNQTGIFDDFFEREDWLEIHNAGSIMNLAGYYLTDNPDSLTKWMVPLGDPGTTTVLPGGKFLVWCDGDVDQGADHASFRLASTGETVLLVAPDGTTVLDEIAFGQQQADISFGRTCDGCPDLQFFNVPTPDAPNADTPAQIAYVFVNEVQTENLLTCLDQTLEQEPWIEIFNPYPFQVNLAGMVVEVDGVGWTLPNDRPWETVVAADGFRLLWLDGETAEGGDHLGFGVPGGPTFSVRLIAADGTVVDEVTAAAAAAGESWGRIADGSAAFTEFAVPTPRVSNTSVFLPAAPVVLNEYLAVNYTDAVDGAGEHEDWVEVYNAGSSPVDLAGHYFTDEVDNPTKWQVPTGFPAETVLAPGGFLLLWADEQTSEGWNHMTFRLSELGEHIALRSPDGYTVLDSLHPGPSWPDISRGRLTDGGEPWVSFSQTTPGASNNGATVDVDAAIQPQRSAPRQVRLLRPGGWVPEAGPADVYTTNGRWVDHVPAGTSGWAIPQEEGSYLLRRGDGSVVGIWVVGE